MDQSPESNEPYFSPPPLLPVFLCSPVPFFPSLPHFLPLSPSPSLSLRDITRYRLNGGKVLVHFTQGWAGPLDLQNFFSLSFYELKKKNKSHYNPFIKSLYGLPFNCLDLDIFGEKTTVSSLFSFSDSFTLAVFQPNRAIWRTT